ncbi:MAG TPA: hypothetical protein VIK72_18465 [Clostridiaceae bacterium]
MNKKMVKTFNSLNYCGNFNLAASILTLVPILCLFFYAQKYFVEGISFTGTKG